MLSFSRLRSGRGDAADTACVATAVSASALARTEAAGPQSYPLRARASAALNGPPTYLLVRPRRKASSILTYHGKHPLLHR